MCPLSIISTFFFFNDTATTEIYTLSLHDALPISCRRHSRRLFPHRQNWAKAGLRASQRDARVASHRDRVSVQADRKSTRLNSSHSQISYAVFCLKKKNRQAPTTVHSPPPRLPLPS